MNRIAIYCCLQYLLSSTLQQLIKFQNPETQQAIENQRLQQLKHFNISTNENTFSMNSVLFNLTVDSFDEFLLDGSKNWFLVFFANWCTHCRHFLPKLNKIAMQIKQDHKYDHIFFGIIDCEQQGYLGYKFGVDQFPTLIYINGNKQYEYLGDENKESILQFMLDDYQKSEFKITRVNRNHLEIEGNSYYQNYVILTIYQMNITKFLLLAFFIFMFCFSITICCLKTTAIQNGSQQINSNNEYNQIIENFSQNLRRKAKDIEYKV